MDIGIRVRPFINESPAGDTGVLGLMKSYVLMLNSCSNIRGLHRPLPALQPSTITLYKTHCFTTF